MVSVIVSKQGIDVTVNWTAMMIRMKRDVVCHDKDLYCMYK